MLLFSDDKLRKKFIQRKDISLLSKEEQEFKWQQQLEGINLFMEILSNIPAIVIPIPPASQSENPR